MKLHKNVPYVFLDINIDLVNSKGKTVFIDFPFDFVDDVKNLNL